MLIGSSGGYAEAIDAKVRQIPHGGAARWRRGPESNRPTRICNPLHNRFATAPSRAPDTASATPTG